MAYFESAPDPLLETNTFLAVPTGFCRRSSRSKNSWKEPDDLHDGLPSFKSTCKARTSKCQYGDTLPDSHLLISPMLMGRKEIRKRQN